MNHDHHHRRIVSSTPASCWFHSPKSTEKHRSKQTRMPTLCFIETSSVRTDATFIMLRPKRASVFFSSLLRWLERTLNYVYMWYSREDSNINYLSRRCCRCLLCRLWANPNKKSLLSLSLSTPHMRELSYRVRFGVYARERAPVYQ